ncbi:MAG: c-type cytochrome [Ferruginibacter sp.]|nr:c-type cytochrome [Ferruginibacter sp.]
MKKSIVVGFFAAICFAFVTITGKYNGDEPEHIAPSKQRTGNAAKGFNYLITGDYLKSGIPYSLYTLATPKDTNNFLQRTGNNKNLQHDFTAVKAPNGELVVAPNCLQCHAQVFDGKLVVGLGNSLSDYTVNREGAALFAETLLKKLTGSEVKKYEAARNFIVSVKTIAPQLIAPVKGVNLADRLAYLLVSHRDPQTLQWSDQNLMALPDDIIPTDVPAWWLLKKKNAMFYNGFGRGDFGRFLMASNLLTVSGTAEAIEVDSHFNDVLAYINSIQPPPYPKPIDAAKATEGKTIFMASCKKCHGTYGADATYPNLLIPASIIKTDSMLYTANYSNPQFIEWFNKSWFTTGDHPAKLVPYRGYIAPPLDGIWVTAPYMHNGSVPNLEAMLNSKIRPAYWQRSFSNPGYNYDIPGWNFITKTEPGDSEVYNTTLKGYSNKGHYFGDKFSKEERLALIEYLKTL